MCVDPFLIPFVDEIHISPVYIFCSFTTGVITYDYTYVLYLLYTIYIYFLFYIHNLRVLGV